MRRPLLTALATTLATLITTTGPASGPATGLAPTAAAAVPVRQIDYTEWTADTDFAAGTADGTIVRDGRLVLGTPTGRRTYAGRSYDTARWTSPWRTPGFGFTELIPSWSATTPGDSWVEVSVRGRTDAGRMSSWDTVARWAAGDRHLRRTSVPGQGDDLADVDVDTWQTADAAGLAGWQLRVTLLRGGAEARSPRVDTLGAVASRLPRTTDVATSAPGVAAGITLPVPRYSQMVHRGHYPRWGDGGQAWCSPTSTSMVLGHYDALPPASAYAWVPDGHVDPWVDYAARMTYDADYVGTGNWPFNTAYAATRAGHAFVTRLRSLREAEQFIAAGIPLVASISFGSDDLDNTPIPATDGHLLVIVGFTPSGDVVVNDPAAQRRAGVRRTYDRGQFEDVWLPRSGGLVYVIRDRAHPLPAGAHSNW